jgi:hypothetical protein
MSTDQPLPSEPPNPTPLLPKTFDQCPVCGSPNKLGLQYLQYLRETKQIHQDSFKGGLMHQIPMLDQAHPPTILGPRFKVKVLAVFWDVCAECGTMYCTKFDVIEGVGVTERPPGSLTPPPPPNFRGPFPRRN